MTRTKRTSRGRETIALLFVPFALFAGALVASCGQSIAPKARSATIPDVGPNELRAPQAFDGLVDRADRSRALFDEVSRVLLHPRCVNCHPSDDSPRQGDDHALHDPPVLRGEKDEGIVGLECTSCHQTKNATLARIPGAPRWHLAPKSMAWLGKSKSAICLQIKDPARNGGKTLAQLVDHSARDALVAWGWAPGADRSPAPGTQARFGELVAAWIATGAECPIAPAEANGAEK